MRKMEMVDDFVYDEEERKKIIVKAELIDKVAKALEVRLWNTGMYRKMTGCWDVSAEFDEELTIDAFDEQEEGEDTRLGFKITESCEDEDGGSSSWSSAYVDIDTKGNILQITDV